MKTLAIFFIHFIASVFKAMGIRACRFYPSCSCYAHSAFNRFGFFVAAYWTLRRILRCHPFSVGGYDPLPENKLHF